MKSKRAFIEALQHTPNHLALLTSLKSGKGVHKTKPDHRQERKRERYENRNLEKLYSE